ncbi:MAG: hypothetical protein ACREAC_33070, partial [Blastocatellia bacterium]
TGVAEVWRYHKQMLVILRLTGNLYVEQTSSQALPGVTSAGLSQLIAEGRELKRTAWIRKVREWAVALKTQSV